MLKMLIIVNGPLLTCTEGMANEIYLVSTTATAYLTTTVKKTK